MCLNYVSEVGMLNDNYSFKERVVIFDLLNNPKYSGPSVF